MSTTEGSKMMGLEIISITERAGKMKRERKKREEAGKNSRGRKQNENSKNDTTQEKNEET